MIKIVYNLIKIIISFSVLLWFAGCSTTNQSNKKHLQSDQELVAVGVFLPLSSEQQNLGVEYTSLIKSGMKDGANTKIKLFTYNSADTQDLKNIVDKMLTDNIKVVIGPISSEETKLLANQLEAKGSKELIVFSLSNDPSIADADGNIFVFGHAPMKQIEQITAYLINNDYKNYVVMLPAGRHSETIAKIVENMVAGRGGKLAKTEFYGNSENELGKTVEAVSKIVDSINEQDENLKQPVIILGDDSKNLQKILQFASKYNLDKKAVFAGDNRLGFVKNSNFDVFFTGATGQEEGVFENRLQALGIENANFMHQLSYDIGKMVAHYLKANYSKNDFINDITNDHSFSGFSGHIKFVDAIAQRQYDIIHKNRQQSGHHDNKPLKMIEKETVKAIEF